MKTLNLCEILKGHKGETFYSSLFGVNVTLYGIQNNKILFYGGHVDLFDDGSYVKGGECMLFPSKNQRNWNKWAEENKLKVPKTWSEIATFSNNLVKIDSLTYISGNTPIENQLLPFLKFINSLKLDMIKM